MKKISRFLWTSVFLIFIYIFYGCYSGRHTHHGNSKGSSDPTLIQNTTQDSGLAHANIGESVIPWKVYPIQQDSALFHNFGEFSLTKNTLPPSAGGLGEYLSLNQINGYRYYENYPLVVTKINSSSNLVEEILYYDSSRNKVVNRINIKALNPYTKDYRNLHYKYPSFEYYDNPPDSLKNYYKNAKPDSHLSYFETGGVQLNGYTAIEYYLIGIKDNYIQSWETTILIFNSNGHLIGRIKEPNVVSVSTISDNGTLVGYKYGDYSENPYDDAPNGEVRIRDIMSGDLIFKYSAELDYKVGLGRYPDIGSFIGIGHELKSNLSEIIKIDLIDLNHRIHYTRDFTREEYVQAMRQNNCTACLIYKYSFIQTKI